MILFCPERTLETALAHKDRPAGDIQDALLSAVRRFAGDTPQFDDITLMVVVRDSPGQDGMHTAAETVQ